MNIQKLQEMAKPRSEEAIKKAEERKKRKIITKERNKKGFYYCGEVVSWNELPLEVRKHDYPYYFKGDLDCYPFKVS